MSTYKLNDNCVFPSKKFIAQLIIGPSISYRNKYIYIMDMHASI